MGQAMTFQENAIKAVKYENSPKMTQRLSSYSESEQQSSSSDDVVITAGMLGLDSSKGREDQDIDDLEIDLINGSILSPQKSFEDTFNITPGDLSSLLMSQFNNYQNNNFAANGNQADQVSSKLNTSENELLAAMIE